MRQFVFSFCFGSCFFVRFDFIVVFIVRSQYVCGSICLRYNISAPHKLSIQRMLHVQILSMDNVYGFICDVLKQIEVFVIFKGQKQPIDQFAGNILFGLYTANAITYCHLCYCCCCWCCYAAVIHIPISDFD